MTPNEKFRAKRAQLGLSQSAISKLGGWNIRTVGRWERDEQEVPAPVLVLLDLLEAVRGVTPPPRGSHPAHDRDEPCCQAIDPHLDLLSKQARAVGWIEPEIVSAVLSWAVYTTLESAGPDAARELLTDALEVVELSDGPGDGAPASPRRLPQLPTGD